VSNLRQVGAPRSRQQGLPSWVLPGRAPQRAARTVLPSGREATVRTRTFSQAPRAVRSAGGRRWDVSPARTPANRAFDADKRDPLRLSIQVDRFRDISATAAVRAVGQSHSRPPQVKAILTPDLPVLGTRSFCVTNREQVTGPSRSLCLYPAVPSSGSETLNKKKLTGSETNRRALSLPW